MKINITKFAQFLGKSGQYVRLLIEQGLPAEGTGRRGRQVFVHTDEAITWLLARERAKVEAELAPDDATASAATKRLRAAQADLAELDASERRGELVAFEDIKQVVLASSMTYRQQLLALPGRMAQQMAACTDPAMTHSKLLEECCRILQLVSDELNQLADAAEDASQ